MSYLQRITNKIISMQNNLTSNDILKNCLIKYSNWITEEQSIAVLEAMNIHTYNNLKKLKETIIIETQGNYSANKEPIPVIIEKCFKKYLMINNIISNDKK